MHHEPGFGLVVAAFTMAAAAVARVLVVAQEVTPSVTASGWIDNGIAAASVGALIYIARLFAKGDLVARPSAENEAKALELAERLAEMTEKAHQRERDYIDALRGAK